MRYKLTPYFIIILTIIQFNSFAQGVRPFINYNVQDGLPSSEVYYSLQDSKGFMWFATDRGVVRFDGYTFEVFSTDDGLSNNVVFEIFEDAKGRIWFLDLNNTFSYFQNEKIYPYKYNNKLKSIGHSYYIYYSFYVDIDDNLYIGGHSGLLHVSNKGKISIKNESDEFELTSIKIENQHLGFEIGDEIEGNKVTINIGDFNCEENLNGGKKFKIKEDSNNIYIIYGSNLIVYNKVSQNHDFIRFDTERDVVSLYVHKDEIYIGLLRGEGKVFQFKNDTLTEINHFFLGQTISSFNIDNNDGLWITTTQNGIYYCPSNFITTIDKKQGLYQDYIYQLTVSNDKIGVGMGDFYQIIKNNTLQKPKKLKYYKTKVNPKHHLEIIDSKITHSGLELYNLEENFQYPMKELGTYWIEKNQESGKIFVANRKELFEYKNNEFHRVLNNHTRKFEKICDYKIGNDSIWVAASNGFGKLIDSISVKSYKNELYNYRVTGVESTVRFPIVFSTRGAGVVFRQGDSLFNISKKDGLITNQFNNVIIDKDENIWAISNLGLYRFNKTNPMIHDYFSTNYGLPSNEITDLVFKDSLAYVATKKGLGIIELNKFHKNSSPPNVYVKSIKINDSIISLPKNKAIICVPQNSTLININYIGINYKSLGELTYKYKLEGIHNEWITTASTNFQLTNLPIRGEYTFKV